MSDAEGTPTWFEAIDAVVQRRLRSVNTCDVGRVESYDDETRTAVVQPLIMEEREGEDGEIVARRIPTIPRAVFAHVGRFKSPVHPGDVVLLVYASAPLDRWLAGGGSREVAPGDDRRHARHDAIAIPMPRADADPQVEVTDTEVHAGGSAALALQAELANLKALIAAWPGTGTTDAGASLKAVFASWATPGTVVLKGA